MANRYYQGEYKVENRDKYAADKTPYFRSSWERRSFFYFDHNKNVISWASENITIPYYFPVDDKNHRYTPDIYCKVKNRDGQLKEFLLEVKPEKQTKPPKPPKRKTAKAMRNYNLAKLEVLKNTFKWEAAEKYCKKRGWVFKVITEKHLQI